jgi:hypothetical protein
MPLSDDDRNAFVDAYTKALVSSWSSEEYAARLDSDPRAALAEVGLHVPAGARVSIIRTIPEEPAGAEAGQEEHLNRQIALWQAGVETGFYEVYIPDTPQIDAANLDLDQLADVAGGSTIACCCCPCSCCT